MSTIRNELLVQLSGAESGFDAVVNRFHDEQRRRFCRLQLDPFFYLTPHSNDSCETEGETRENLLSAFGACAHELWMRVNCRRTCGTCGIPLHEVLMLKPRRALLAARTAAEERGSPMLQRLIKEGHLQPGWRNVRRAEAQRAGKHKQRTRAKLSPKLSQRNSQGPDAP